MSHISIIVAMDRNRGIGLGNKIPWHLPADLKRFKELTMGHPVIMGRTTFESILGYLGKPLPGRSSVVVSRTPQKFEYPNCFWAGSIESAIEKAQSILADDGEGEVFIGGGAQIYAQSLPFATRLYLTIIDKEFAVDTFFPEYPEFTKVVAEEEHEFEGLKYKWLILEKVS